MPTASPEVRKPWHDKRCWVKLASDHKNWYEGFTFFGWALEGGGDFCALRYLEKRGYTEDRGMIKPPRYKKPVFLVNPIGTPFTRPNKKEWSAICYLCDEWDFAYSGHVEKL